MTIAHEPSIFNELFSRRRRLLIAAVFGVELGLLVAGLLAPLDQASRQSLASQANTQFSSINNAAPPQVVYLIFSHNLLIALVEMVPILGAMLLAYSIFSTGLVAQALLSSKGVPSALGIVLLILPYSLVELSSYAVAVGSGIMLVLAWRRRKLRREAGVFLLELVVVVLLLIVAATMEEVTNLAPLVGFALWVPTGLAVAVLAVLARRAR
jgi:uncharacterized membrane protein SpoIIM required for sporulation